MNSTTSGEECDGCVPARLLKEPKIMTAVAYSVTFVIAIAGNVAVFALLCSKITHRKHSKIHIFLLHMCLADLLVTLVYMPQQALWSLTVYWLGPDWLCRVCHFLAVLGTYLSAAVLVCLNIDQVYAIAAPLRDLSSVTNTFLMVAWTCAVVASVPQLFLFEKVTHPVYPSIAQCVPIHMTENDAYWRLVFVRLELGNTLLNALLVYILPVTIVTVCQVIIIVKIQRRRIDAVNLNACGANRTRELGPTSENSLHRAQQRATRVTIAAVLAFIICWTPYYVVAIVHFLGTDFDTGEVRDLFPALHITPEIRELLEWFSVFKSSVNPYLYGLFAFKLSWAHTQRQITQKYRANFVKTTNVKPGAWRKERQPEQRRNRSEGGPAVKSGESQPVLDYTITSVAGMTPEQSQMASVV